jgi:hypothetical protein
MIISLLSATIASMSYYDNKSNSQLDTEISLYAAFSIDIYNYLILRIVKFKYYYSVYIVAIIAFLIITVASPIGYLNPLTFLATTPINKLTLLRTQLLFTMTTTCINSDSLNNKITTIYLQ